jgi:hypothetical protein
MDKKQAWSEVVRMLRARRGNNAKARRPFQVIWLCRPRHESSNSQRPAGISANGPFVTFRLTALALAVAAAAFLVELLEHAAGVSSSRGNGASQEGQGNEG